MDELGGRLTGTFCEIITLILLTRTSIRFNSWVRNPYAKCAIKCSGRSSILVNAVKLPNLNRLLWTPERQRYFKHFNQAVVSLSRQHHKTKICRLTFLHDTCRQATMTAENLELTILKLRSPTPNFGIQFL